MIAVEKIITFCKRKYKILIPIMVVFVLLVAVYFLYKEYKYDNYRNKQEVSVYQYFGGIKNEYTAIITYNLKDIIVDISAKDKKIEYDSTPIYFNDINKIVFPNDMSIVFPLREGSQFRLYKYSEYEKNDNLHMIKNGANKNDYSYFFLFDGKGLFYFPEEITLKVNNNELVKLSAMSYAKIIGGYTLEYYDKEKDTAKVIEIEGKKITAENDKFNINLSERYVMSYDKKVLLVNPYNLNSLNN